MIILLGATRSGIGLAKNKLLYRSLGANFPALSEECKRAKNTLGYSVRIILHITKIKTKSKQVESMSLKNIGNTNFYP